jgi:hypothetical protein
VKSVSPTDSKVILGAILDQYKNFLEVKFADVNKEAAVVITQAQRDLALDLEQAEADYEQFRQASSNLMWKAGDEATNIHRVRYEGILQEMAALQLSSRCHRRSSRRTRRRRFVRPRKAVSRRRKEPHSRRHAPDGSKG